MQKCAQHSIVLCACIEVSVIESCGRNSHIKNSKQSDDPMSTKHFTESNLLK